MPPGERIKDWPDIQRIISSVDQVRIFAGGLNDRKIFFWLRREIL
jgi:hypothetical protein